MWEYSHLPGPLSTAFHEIGFCWLAGQFQLTLAQFGATLEKAAKAL